jgi:hypothetical protein
MKAEHIQLPVEDPRRVDRIREHTASSVLDRIDARTARRIFRAARGGPDGLERRIAEVDKEWDVDRWLQLVFAAGTMVSSVKGRKSVIWRAILHAQQGFLMLDAMVGWCPPVEVLRRIGIRTQKEIDTERAVLVELLHLLKDEEVAVEVVAYEVAPSTDGTAARW